jgi:hypothetical protein
MELMVRAAALTLSSLQNFGIVRFQFRCRMGDVLQHAVNGAFGWIAGQVQNAGSLADGLAELEPVGDLFACGVNE